MFWKIPHQQDFQRKTMPWSDIPQKEKKEKNGKKEKQNRI
mgnify:CR=1 FL=1